MLARTLTNRIIISCKIFFSLFSFSFQSLSSSSSLIPCTFPLTSTPSFTSRVSLSSNAKSNASLPTRCVSSSAKHKTKKKQNHNNNKTAKEKLLQSLFSSFLFVTSKKSKNKCFCCFSSFLFVSNQRKAKPMFCSLSPSKQKEVSSLFFSFVFLLFSFACRQPKQTSFFSFVFFLFFFCLFFCLLMFV